MQVNPKGKGKDFKRVVRGGNSRCQSSVIVSSLRERGFAELSVYSFGFRICLSDDDGVLR